MQVLKLHVIKTLAYESCCFMLWPLFKPCTKGWDLVVLIAGHVMANVNIPQSSDTSLTF